MDTVDEQRLIRLDDVLRICGVSKAHVYRLVAKDEFPAPVRVGPRAARWKLSEILEWMDGLPTATEENWN